MNKAEKASIAFNNKLQIRLMMALMKKAARDTDKRDLLDSYETKLESLEKEFTDKNELLKSLPEQRVKIRKELTSLLDRLEKFGKYNFVVENDKYYKLIPQNPREIVEGTVSGTQTSSLSEDALFQAPASADVDYKITEVERKPRKVEVSLDVYKAAMFEEKQIKQLLKDRQADYSAITKQETELMESYVKSGKKEDLAFKVDVLKEQLANDNIFLDMYIANREDYDGIIYDEKRKVYTPVKYDDYVTTQEIKPDFGGKYNPFRLKVSDDEFKLAQQVQSTRSQKFVTEPNRWFDDVDADYTSKYIQVGPTMKFGVDQKTVGEFFDPGTKRQGNPGTGFKRDLNPMANTQRDMQNQIRPRVERKNQNMNPAGFNIRNYLDK